MTPPPEPRRKLNFWDRMEEAGHTITLISGPSAGQYTYYCEKCAALIVTDSTGVVIFHSPPDVNSTQDECSRKTVVLEADVTLLAKLEINHAAHMEQLRRI